MTIPKFSYKGGAVSGIVEYGSVKEGQPVMIMPSDNICLQVEAQIVTISVNGKRVERAVPHQVIEVQLYGKHKISRGSLVCTKGRAITKVLEFNARLQIVEVLDHDTFTTGHVSRLHIHSLAVNYQITGAIEKIDKDPNNPKKVVESVKKGDLVECRIKVNKEICIEKFEDFKKLGRFVMCKQGKLIAAGLVTSL